MNIVVKAQNLHPQKHNIDVEISIPTTCPRCGVAYREYPKDTYIFQCDSIVNYIGTRVYSFYFCPHCGKGFLVEYSVLDDFHHFSPSSTLKTCNAMAYPAPVRVKDFSQETKVSEFCKNISSSRTSGKHRFIRHMRFRLSQSS